jgi:molybdopterin molybdotransferase
MQEDVTEDHGHIRITAGIAAGQGVRRQGEEFRRGDLVARSAQPLTPPLCSLAATMGLAQIQVARAPRVGLLLTGSELVAPGQPLLDAQIYESNGPGLAAALKLAGIASLDVRSVPDTLEPTVAALSALLDANDVVITSGGVSVGTYDAVKEALQQLGVERRIWRVAIKPGKPFFFGVRQRAGHKTAVFGLPGNPLSALVTFSVFAFPYLRAVQGITAPVQTFSATLASPIKKPAGRLEFVPVTLNSDATGWRATPLDKRASHMLGGFAQAHALAVFPAGLERLEAGQSVECRRLPWT